MKAANFFNICHVFAMFRAEGQCKLTFDRIIWNEFVKKKKGIWVKLIATFCKRAKVFDSII